MKFILIFSILTSQLYAQNISFMDTTNQWSVAFTSREWGKCNETFYYNGDTVINQKKYQKLFRKGARFISNQLPQYQGGIRTDSSGNVYFKGLYNGCSVSGGIGVCIDKVQFEQIETILYNFNLNLGDTTILRVIKNNQGKFDTARCKVINIYYKEAFGKLRKHLVVQGECPFYSREIDIWIEGIGSLSNPIFPSILTTFEYKWQLECFKNKGINFSQNGTACTVSTQNVGAFGRIILAPNPANNNINIDIENFNDVREVKIFDSTGKYIINQKLLNTRYHYIDVSKLSNGIYLIAVLFNQGVFTEKITIVK